MAPTSRRVLWAAALFSVGCHSGIEDSDPSALAKAVPATVSNPQAWRLFDRSTSSAFKPGADPVRLTFDRAEQLSVVKVFGSASYRLRVTSSAGTSLGFDDIDLSALSAGWHAFPSSSLIATSDASLTFEPLGSPSAVPEVELWAVADEATPARPDLTEREVPRGFTAIASSDTDETIEPGSCASFPVELARVPSTFSRAYLTYEATGLFRSFGVRRTVNGRAEQSGAWLAGDQATRTFVDEIDPSALLLGPNEVRLCVPSSALVKARISNLRLVGETDRGISLVSSIRIGTDARDGALLLDHDSSTTLDIAAGERVLFSFDRLIAPDAVVMTGRISDEATIECVDQLGASHSIPFKRATTTTGAIFGLDGGGPVCAQLAFTSTRSASLGEIEVVGSGAAEPVDWPRIVVTSANEHFGDTAWVGGFVARPPVMTGAIRTTVAGQSSAAATGDFGMLVSRTDDPSGSWPVVVGARLPNGSTQTRQVILDRDQRGQLTAAQANTATVSATAPDNATSRFGRQGDSVIVKASPQGTTSIKLGSRIGATVPAGALAQPTAITVRHLGDVDLPPLDPGMINVTAPKGHGYEFLPHGQHFAKAIDVTVPFDPTLIPDEMKPDDVHTFYFDPAAERWKKLDRTSIDVGDRVIHSATDHFTIMVDAVLAVPKNPSPLSFDPTALSSIGAASPAANIDVIEPPQANAMGDAKLSLPIRLPAGRGAYSPSLALTYSSSAGNGWVGVGWDLNISKIEIDTRWGVPTYTDGESPRYLLDGAELVPSDEPAEGPTCANARRYRARIEGAFAHILRCGADPASYHWEVHDRDGTLFVYGDTDSSRLASYETQYTHNGIFRWQLAHVVDVHGNTTAFGYVSDNIAGDASHESSSELYPASITYTGGALTPAFEVDFVLDHGGRPDRIVSGRAGFKVMTRKLLRGVRVSYRGQIFRDYVLTYQTGQFSKTVLQSVKQYGGACPEGLNAFVAPSCSSTPFLDEHTFSWFQEQAQFEAAVAWGVIGDPDPATSTLGKGSSGGLTESFGVSADFGAVSASAGFDHSGITRDELVGIYDVNGDGLPDQVFRTGAGLGGDATFAVLQNRLQPSTDPANPSNVALLRGTTATISGFPGLGNDDNSTWGLKLSATVAKTLHAGAGISDTTSRANRLVTDLDGDGFIDVVSADGTAKLGQPCPAGLCASDASFGALGSIDPHADSLLNYLNADVRSRTPMADPFVQWVAPWDGTVTVTGTAHKVHAGGNDGVTVFAYHDDDALGSLSISADDTATYAFPNATSIDVHAGEGIYLRVATGLDEALSSDGTPLDLVDARLQVTYTSVCTPGCFDVTDPNAAHDPMGQTVFAFDSHNDLRIAGAPSPLVIRASGMLDLHANFVKPPTIALNVCIQHFRSVNLLANKSLDRPCSETDADVQNVSGTLTLTAASTPLDTSLAVDAGELLMVRVESPFYFDPAGISLQPESAAVPIAAYTQVCSPAVSGGTHINCSTDPAILAATPISLAGFGPFIPIPVAPPGVPFVASTAGNLNINAFNAPLEPFQLIIRSDVQGELLFEDCTVSSCMSPINAPSISTQVGESITFEIVTQSGAFPSSTLEVHYDGQSEFAVPLNVRSLTPDTTAGFLYVGGYRQFHAGFWNEEFTFAPAALLIDIAGFPFQQRTNEIVQSIIPAVPSFGGDPYTGGAPAWVASSQSTFVSAVGLDATPVTDLAALYAQNYTRLSGTFSFYLSGGATVGVPGLHIGADVSASASWTDTTTDVEDMNGDGIADVVTSGKTTLGALNASAVGAGATAFNSGDQLRHRDAVDYTVGFGGDAGICSTTSSGRPLLCDGPNGPDQGFLGLSAGTGLAIARTQTTKDLRDVNGDGLPDIVVRDGASIYVQLNLGNRYGAREAYGTLASNMLVHQDGFQSLEFDSTSNALAHETTITTDESGGFNFVVVSCSTSSKHTSSRTTRQLADINGDGLPDLLYRIHGENVIRVQINRGADFDPNMTTWQLPVGWPAPVDLSKSFGGVTETILDWIANTEVTGPDVLAGTSTQDGSSDGCGIHIPITSSISLDLGLTDSSSHDTYELALLDVDGDGAADHVLRSGPDGGDGKIYVKHNDVTGKANLLQSVLRPLGATITLDYTRVGNTVDMPHSRQVLSRVQVDPGVNLGPDFPIPKTVTTIGYEQGFFDRNEKEFFGFSKVTTTRIDSSSIALDAVEDDYENATYPLHGRLLSETRRDRAGRLFHQHAIQYAVQGVLGSDGATIGAAASCTEHLHPLLAREGSAACTPVFPVVTRDDDTRAEGGLAQKTRTMLDGNRDRFGNELTSSDSGDDAITGDEIVASATYANDTTNWILGRPTSLELRNGTGTLLRHRTGTYDTLGEPIEIDVDTGSGLATTTLTYDQFGNVASVVTPPNESGQTQTHRIDCDQDAGVYPTRVIDSFQLQSTAEYDVRFGVATKETDTNGAMLTRKLDAFGRITQVQGPYDTAATTQGIVNQYFPGDRPARAVTLMTPTAPPGYTGGVAPQTVAVTVVDGLGRVVEQRKTAVVDGVSGMTTSGLVVRDDFGRVIVTQNPFFGVSVDRGVVPPLVTEQTHITYDVLDRPVQTTYADNQIERAVFDIAADPDGRSMFLARAIDPNGHARETYTDQVGRTRAFVEHPDPAASPSVTRYDYLPTGELSHIVDAESHPTSLGYDLRGLRTSLQNADYGLIEERYDAMGNRIALVEPNHRALGTRVHYVYDRDRLVTIDYPSKPDVTFTYGAPGAPNFGVGRVVAVADETGTQQHEYGALGELRRTVRTVVSGNQSYTFDLHLTSDSFGRQLQVGYPDGEVVTNQYDAAGMLNLVTGAGGTKWSRTYASDIRYDRFGNRSHMVYGNGAVSDWTYDPTRIRLLSVSTKLASGTKLQALQYSYDPASNPVVIENNLPALTGGSGTTPGYSKLTLKYDGVDRLLSAVGNAQLDAQKTTFYDQESTYSASHNILHKQRLHTITASSGSVSTPVATNFTQDYTYGARPHLPTNIDGLAITYDASGNPLDRLKVGTSSVLTLTWDDDNRMTDATGSSVNQHNSYDASGNRVRRKSTQSETIFSSQYFDLDNGTQGTKHVFAGSTRVASELGKFASGVNPVAPSKQGAAFFFHSDRLASTHVLTDDKGGIQESLEFFADGETWIDRGPQTPVTGYLFSGKPIDPDTGFYDFGQRFYDPRTSLWLGSDRLFVDNTKVAIGKPALIAATSFAANNPMSHSDPDGRCPICLGVIFALMAMEETEGEKRPSDWQLVKKATLGAMVGESFWFPKQAAIVGLSQAKNDGEAATALLLGGTAALSDAAQVGNAVLQRVGDEFANMAAAEKQASQIAGALGGRKVSPFNPTGATDNCVNCVASFIDTAKNRSLVQAGSQVAENGGSIARANAQIVARTGVRLGERQFSTLNTARDEQFFIVYKGSNPTTTGHVLVGVTKRGRSWLYDPQSAEKITDLKAFGPFIAYPVGF